MAAGLPRRQVDIDAGITDPPGEAPFDCQRFNGLGHDDREHADAVDLDRHDVAREPAFEPVVDTSPHPFFIELGADEGAVVGDAHQQRAATRSVRHARDLGEECGDRDLGFAVTGEDDSGLAASTCFFFEVYARAFCDFPSGAEGGESVFDGLLRWARCEKCHLSPPSHSIIIYLVINYDQCPVGLVATISFPTTRA